MGKGKYYLSQSTTNAGRKNPKGLHVAIWEFHNGMEVPPEHEIHHKDGNPHNNDISNLECLSIKEHRSRFKFKSEESFKKQMEHLEKIRDMSKKWHSSPEGRKWHSENAKRAMQKRKLIDLKCIFCGKEHKSKYGFKQFCSNSCSQKYYYWKKRGFQPDRS